MILFGVRAQLFEGYCGIFELTICNDYCLYQPALL